MGDTNMEASVRELLLTFQRNEITEHHIYRKLAGTITFPGNREILERIAEDELRHYHEWKKYTQKEVSPHRLKVWFYYAISLRRCPPIG